MLGVRVIGAVVGRLFVSFLVVGMGRAGGDRDIDGKKRDVWGCYV